MPIDNTVLDSDFSPVLFEGITKGISRGFASHLLPKDRWWDSWNFRFNKGTIQQIVSLKPFASLDTDTTDVQVITLVAHVPATSSRMLVLSQKKLYTSTAASGSVLAMVQDYSVQYAAFLTHGNDLWRRWAYKTDHSYLYFTRRGGTGGGGTDPGVPLQKFETVGGVTTLITSGPQYTGLFVEVFHNHLVIANTYDAVNGEQQNRIAWSDVNAYNVFLPSPTNEADFFIIEQDSTDAPGGGRITGMAKLGNSLYIYTAHDIWQMQYVGLPNVMVINCRMRGVGSYYPYALASVLDTHYFIGAGGFYMFDGTTVRSFGEDIWEYFRATISPLYGFGQKTHCIVDPVRQEIIWYYCSKASTGTIDTALIYNYIEETWAPIEGRGILCMQNTAFVRYQAYTAMENLAGNFNALVGIMDNLNNNVTVSVPDNVLFGTSGGLIRREVREDDAQFSDIIPEDNPFLVTGDIHFGTTSILKELAAVRLDASWTKGSNVSVQIWGRYYLAQQNLIRPAWSTNQSYEIGDEVSYDGKVWRKVQNVPVPISSYVLTRTTDPFPHPTQTDALWREYVDDPDLAYIKFEFPAGDSVLPGASISAAEVSYSNNFDNLSLGFNPTIPSITFVGIADFIQYVQVSSTTHSVNAAVYNTAPWSNEDMVTEVQNVLGAYFSVINYDPGTHTLTLTAISNEYTIAAAADYGFFQTAVGEQPLFARYLYNIPEPHADNNLVRYFSPPSDTHFSEIPELSQSITYTLTGVLVWPVPGTAIEGYGQEWEAFAYSGDSGGFVEIGLWEPRQFQQTAGWLQIGQRMQSWNPSRVHRLKFEFNGPPSGEPPQPQGAIFNLFEEYVYQGKPEL